MGAEVLWAEHRNMTVGKLPSWVKQKSELESFDDTQEKGGLPHR